MTIPAPAAVTGFESPLPEGRGFLDTVLGSLRLPVTLCLAWLRHKWRRLRETRVQSVRFCST